MNSFSRLEICITYIQYLTLYYKITIVNSIPAHTNPNSYFVLKNAGVKYFWCSDLKNHKIGSIQTITYSFD